MVNYDIANNKAAHKYLLKVFYNKTNKNKYDFQIRQYNVRYTNIIIIKDIIAIAEKDRENKKLWTIENVDKIAMVEVTKLLSAIDFGSKYSYAMNNTDIDVAKNLKLIDIKKY